MLNRPLGINLTTNDPLNKSPFVFGVGNENFPPESSDFMITESGVLMITEGGNFMITEGS